MGFRLAPVITVILLLVGPFSGLVKAEFIQNMVSLAITRDSIPRAIDFTLPLCGDLTPSSSARHSLAYEPKSKASRRWPYVYLIEGRCTDVINMTKPVDPVSQWLRAVSYQGLGQGEAAADAYRQAGAAEYPEKQAQALLKIGNQEAGVGWLEVALLTRPTRWTAEKLAGYYSDHQATKGVRLRHGNSLHMPLLGPMKITGGPSAKRQN